MCMITYANYGDNYLIILIQAVCSNRAGGKELLLLVCGALLKGRILIRGIFSRSCFRSKVKCGYLSRSAKAVWTVLCTR